LGKGVGEYKSVPCTAGGRRKNLLSLRGHGQRAGERWSQSLDVPISAKRKDRFCKPLEGSPQSKKGCYSLKKEIGRNAARPKKTPFNVGKLLLSAERQGTQGREKVNSILKVPQKGGHSEKSKKTASMT